MEGEGREIGGGGGGRDHACIHLHAVCACRSNGVGDGEAGRPGIARASSVGSSDSLKPPTFMLHVCRAAAHEMRWASGGCARLQAKQLCTKGDKPSCSCTYTQNATNAELAFQTIL